MISISILDHFLMSWLSQVARSRLEVELCVHCNKHHRTSPDRCWYAVCTTCGQQGHAFCCSHCGRTHRDRDPDHCTQMTCSYCNRKGHSVAVCNRYLRTIAKPCVWCKQSGHVFADCPQRCHICPTQLHRQRDCPIGLQQTICHSCHNKGHRANNCPKYECTICSKLGHREHKCPIRCTNSSCTREEPHHGASCPNRYKWALSYLHDDTVAECDVCHQVTVLAGAYTDTCDGDTLIYTCDECTPGNQPS